MHFCISIFSIVSYFFTIPSSHWIIQTPISFLLDVYYTPFSSALHTFFVTIPLLKEDCNRPRGSLFVRFILLLLLLSFTLPGGPYTLEVGSETDVWVSYARCTLYLALI
jgi:hypothetical protein